MVDHKTGVVKCDNSAVLLWSRLMIFLLRSHLPVRECLFYALLTHSSALGISLISAFAKSNLRTARPQSLYLNMRCWLVHAGKESLESSVNLFVCVSLIIFRLQEGVHWKTLIVCADTMFVIIRIPVDAKTRWTWATRSSCTDIRSRPPRAWMQTARMNARLPTKSARRSRTRAT
jgi:hypothetical protein